MRLFQDLDVRDDGAGNLDIALDVDTRDAATDTGLWSAVLVSLFSDRRAAADEVADPLKRRGWIGNTVSEIPGDNFGSGLWLYEQSRMTGDVVAAVEAEARNALQWLIEEGLVTSVVAQAKKDDAARLLTLFVTLGLIEGGVSQHSFALVNATRTGLLQHP